VGAGGMRLFRLKAKSAGEAKLSFGYHRVRSEEPPEKQHSVTVTITP
jgi:predicted secreted protein